MFPSQSNPESPNRYAFLKQPPLNSNKISSTVTFLNSRLNEVKQADYKLKDGIQETRSRLITHLNQEQANQLQTTPHVVSNIKYPINLAPQTTKNQYQGQKVIIGNFHTPMAGQNNVDVKNLQFKRPPVNLVAEYKFAHSEPTSPINCSKISTQHKIECRQCQKLNEIIRGLEEKLREVNQKAHLDRNQFSSQFKFVSSQRDALKFRLAQYDKDKSDQIANLQKIIDEFRKKQLNEANQKHKFKYLNDSTKSQNVTSLKLEVEELKYKNNHLNKKIKEKTEKLSDLQILLQQLRADKDKNQSISQRPHSGSEVSGSMIDRYNELAYEYEHLKNQKSAEIEQIMKRFNLANQRMQETLVHNQNMFNQINELNELMEEYREQNSKLKVLNQKYQADLQKKEQEVADLYEVIEEFKEKNMQTVQQYNQLVQKIEMLEQKAKRLSYLETEVSSQVSGMKSHKHSEEIWQKKQKELLSKIEHFESQVELINRQKQAEIEERKVYELKSKQLYEKIRELNEQNYKLRCTLRDEDEQKSQIVYFNKQKIDSLLSPSYSRAGSMSSGKFNDRDFLQKDRFIEKAQVQKHALQVQQIKTKVEALMKKVEILGSHLSSQHHLLRQESNRSKFKMNQVQIPTPQNPLGVSPSSRSKTKLHRHSQSNAQIEFSEQNIESDPNNYVSASLNTGQIVKVQNQIYGEWKQWSIEMAKISRQLQTIIEQQSHQMNILTEQIQELNLEKARIYGSLGNSERIIEKIKEQNSKLRLELDETKIQSDKLKLMLKKQEEYDVYLKTQNLNNEEKSKQYRKQSEKYEAEYEIAKTKLDVLEISNREWEAHFVQLQRENLEIMAENKELRVENLSLTKFKTEIQLKITKQNQLNFSKIKAQESLNDQLKKQINDLKRRLQAQSLTTKKQAEGHHNQLKDLQAQNFKLRQDINGLQQIRKKNEETMENLVGQLQDAQMANERIKQEYHMLQKINQEAQFENVQKIKLFQHEISHLQSKKAKLEESLLNAEDYIEVILKQNSELKSTATLQKILEQKQEIINNLHKQIIEDKAILLRLQHEIKKNQLKNQKAKRQNKSALISVYQKLKGIQRQVRLEAEGQDEGNIQQLIEKQISQLQNGLQKQRMQTAKALQNLEKAEAHIESLYLEIDTVKSSAQKEKVESSNLRKASQEKQFKLIELISKNQKMTLDIKKLKDQVEKLNDQQVARNREILNQFNSQLKEVEILISERGSLQSESAINQQPEKQINLKLTNLKNKLQIIEKEKEEARKNLSVKQSKIVGLNREIEELRIEKNQKDHRIRELQAVVQTLKANIDQEVSVIHDLEAKLKIQQISNQEKDSILNSIYQKLQVIERDFYIKSQASFLQSKPVDLLEVKIERKVEDLKLKLAEEKMEHDRAYESLSRAEDHIIQLYSDIQLLKKDLEEKVIKLQQGDRERIDLQYRLQQALSLNQKTVEETIKKFEIKAKAQANEQDREDEDKLIQLRKQLNSQKVLTKKLIKEKAQLQSEIQKLKKESKEKQRKIEDLIEQQKASLANQNRELLKLKEIEIKQSQQKAQAKAKKEVVEATKQIERIRKQLNEQKVAAEGLRQEKIAKDLVLASVYDNLLRISDETESSKDAVKSPSRIEEIIQQKVQNLKQKLIKEKVEHDRAYEGLSKAQDHIIQLYSNIEELKKESEAKEQRLKELISQIEKQQKNSLAIQSKQVMKVKDEVKRRNQQNQKLLKQLSIYELKQRQQSKRVFLQKETQTQQIPVQDAPSGFELRERELVEKNQQLNNQISALYEDLSQLTIKYDLSKLEHKKLSQELVEVRAKCEQITQANAKTLQQIELAKAAQHNLNNSAVKLQAELKQKESQLIQAQDHIVKLYQQIRNLQTVTKNQEINYQNAITVQKSQFQKYSRQTQKQIGQKENKIKALQLTLQSKQNIIVQLNQRILKEQGAIQKLIRQLEAFETILSDDSNISQLKNSQQITQAEKPVQQRISIIKDKLIANKIKAGQISSVQEQKVSNLEQEAQLMKKEIIATKKHDKENEEKLLQLSKQLKSKNIALEKLTQENQARNLMLTSVYDNLLRIDGDTKPKIDDVKSLNRIEEIIERKVEDLMQKLAEEKIEHDKAYESLSKAEDHIIQLYSDIETLKQASEEKEKRLERVILQITQQKANLNNQLKQTLKLKQEIVRQYERNVETKEKKDTQVKEDIQKEIVQLRKAANADKITISELKQEQKLRNQMLTSVYDNLLRISGTTEPYKECTVNRIEEFIVQKVEDLKQKLTEEKVEHNKAYESLSKAQDHIIQVYSDIETLKKQLEEKEKRFSQLSQEKANLENQCIQTVNLKQEAVKATIRQYQQKQQKIIIKRDKEKQERAKEIQQLKKQLSEEKSTIEELRKEQEAKSLVLTAVYEHLLKISGDTESNKDTMKSASKIEESIGQKVENLIQKLAQEKVEHDKAYESLSKAQDHIIQLYSDIESLKKESEEKQKSLSQNIAQLHSERKQNLKLQEENTNLKIQIENVKLLNSQLTSSVTDLQVKLKQAQQYEILLIESAAQGNQLKVIKEQIQRQRLNLKQINSSLSSQLKQQQQKNKRLTQEGSNLKAEKQKNLASLVAAENYIEFLLKESQDIQEIQKLQQKTLQEKQIQLDEEIVMLKSTIDRLEKKDRIGLREVTELKKQNEELKKATEESKKYEALQSQSIQSLQIQVQKLRQQIIERQAQNKKLESQKKQAEIRNENLVSEMSLQVQNIKREKSELHADVARLEAFADQIVQENRQYRRENQAYKSLVMELQENNTTLKEEIHYKNIESAKCLKIIQELTQEKQEAKVEQTSSQPEQKSPQLSQILQRNYHMIKILNKSLQTQQETIQADKKKYQQVLLDVETSQQKIKAQQQKISELQQKLNQNLQKESLKVQKHLYDTTYDNLVKAEQYINQIQQENERLILENIQLLTDCQGLQEKIRVIGEQMGRLETRCGQLDQEKKEIYMELENVKKSQTDSQKQYEIQANHIKELTNNLENQIALYKQLEQQNKTLSSLLQSSTAQSKCLQQQLQRAIQQKNTAITQIQKQVQNFQQTKAKLQIVLSDFSQAYEEESSKLNNKIEMLSREQVQIMGSYQLEKVENGKLRELVEELRKQEELLIEDYQRRIGELANQLQVQANQCKSFKDQNINLNNLHDQANRTIQQQQEDRQKLMEKAKQENKENMKIIDDLQNLLNQKLIQLEKSEKANNFRQNSILDLNSVIAGLTGSLDQERQLKTNVLQQVQQIKAKYDELLHKASEQLIQNNKIRQQKEQINQKLKEVTYAKQKQEERSLRVQKLYEQQCQKKKALQLQLSQVNNQIIKVSEKANNYEKINAIQQKALQQAKNSLEEQKRQHNMKDQQIRRQNEERVSSLQAQNLQINNQLKAANQQISGLKQEAKTQMQQKQKQVESVLKELGLIKSEFKQKQASLINLNHEKQDLIRKLKQTEHQLHNQQQLNKAQIQTLIAQTQSSVSTILSLKTTQIQESKQKIDQLQQTVSQLTRKLEYQLQDKAQIYKDNTQMWNDLQLARNQISILDLSLREYGARLDQETKANQILRAENQERKVHGERVVKELESCKNQVKDLGAKIKELEKSKDEKYATLQEELSKQKSMRIKIEGQHQQSKSIGEKAIKAEKMEKQSLKTVIRNLEQRLNTFEASLNKKQASSINRQKQYEQVLKQKEERIKQLSSQIEKANNQLVTTHNQLQLTHTQIQNTMSVLQQIQNQFKILSESNLERQQQLVRAAEENSGLRQQVVNIRKENEEWKAKLGRAQSHILYQEQYIDEMSQNERKLAQSENRCMALQNRIHEIEEYFKQALSPQVQQKMKSVGEDFIKVEDYFLRAIQEEKKKVYEAFIQEHPQKKQSVKIDNGELIILGGSGQQLKMQEINDLNDKIVKIEDKKKQMSESLNSLKDTELKLSFAEKKIKELQSELSRHQSNRTSLASSLEAMEKNFKQIEPIHDRSKENQEQEELQSNEGEEGNAENTENVLQIEDFAAETKKSQCEKSQMEEIEALRQTVYEQQQKIAFLQQQLQNKKIELEQLSQQLPSRPIQPPIQSNKSTQPNLQPNPPIPIPLAQHQQKQQQLTNTILHLTDQIKQLSDQLASEQNEHLQNLKVYEEQINHLNRRMNQQAEQYQGVNLVVERLGKEQHVIKQNLIIVEAIRDQLTEENGMLVQQVARYEEIIAQLQNKQVQEPPKSARARIEVQTLQAQIAELKGNIQLLQQQKAQIIKQCQQKLQKSQQQSTNALQSNTQLLNQKLSLQNQLSQQHQQIERSLAYNQTLAQKLEQLRAQYLRVDQLNIKLREDLRKFEQEIGRMEVMRKEDGEREEAEKGRLRNEKEGERARADLLDKKCQQIEEKYSNLKECLQKIDQKLNQMPIPQMPSSQNKPGENQQPNIESKTQRLVEALKTQSQKQSQIESENEALKSTIIQLSSQVSALKNEVKDFDGKVRSFESVAIQLEKQLKDVYQKLADKQKKQEKHKHLKKQNEELQQKLNKKQSEQKQFVAKMTQKLSQTQKRQASALEQNRKLAQKLQQAQKKLQDQQGEKDVDQQIEKARLSLDQGFKKQKSQRRSSIEKQRLTDRDRISMLERIIYQLQQQVKSFERSVENLTQELSVYQNKQAEWVENQNRISEIIDTTEKISANLQRIKQKSYKDEIVMEYVSTQLPWLANLNRLIKESLEAYQKQLKLKDEQITNLREARQEHSSFENQIRMTDKTPSKSSSEERPESSSHQSNIIQERYEQLLKQYVLLENQNKTLAEEVGKLEREVEGYKKKVAELAKNLVETSNANKSQQQNFQLRKKLESAEHELLKSQAEKDVSKFLVNEDEDNEDEYQRIRLRSRDLSREDNNTDYIIFLNECLKRLDKIEEDSENLQQQFELNSNQLQDLIEKVCTQLGQHTPEASSVRKSQQLVNQFRQLLYSQQQPRKKSQPQPPQAPQFSPEHPNQPQILQIPNQFSHSPEQSPQLSKLLGPININDRNQLIKQIKQLSELMNMYHTEYQNIRNKYTRNIKKLRVELCKVKDVSVDGGQDVGEGGVGDSAVDRMVGRIAELVDKLSVQYNQLVENEDALKFDDLDIIQEDVHNEDNENRSISTPKSNRKSKNLFTPKSGYSSKSQKQLISKYKDANPDSINTPQQHYSNSLQCQTNLQPKPFIDYLLDSNQFERVELLELKKKIAAMRSRQDKINMIYLEDQEKQIEGLIRYQKERLPDNLKEDTKKIVEILSMNLELEELKGMVELGAGDKLIDKVIEAIDVMEQQQSQQKQFEKFFETSRQREKRKKLISQANTIRTKYYQESNQFSVDILDCLVSFYNVDTDSEEFLIVVDKIFQTIASMQKNMERSLYQREKLVEGHSQALKKILEKQSEIQQEMTPENQSPSSKYQQSQFELKHQASHNKQQDKDK